MFRVGRTLKRRQGDAKDVSYIHTSICTYKKVAKYVNVKRGKLFGGLLSQFFFYFSHLFCIYFWLFAKERKLKSLTTTLRAFCSNEKFKYANMQVSDCKFWLVAEVVMKKNDWLQGIELNGLNGWAGSMELAHSGPLVFLRNLLGSTLACDGISLSLMDSFWWLSQTFVAKIPTREMMSYVCIYVFMYIYQRLYGVCSF